MSRAINIDAQNADTAAMCAKRNVAISAIEAPLSGDGHGAGILRHAYRTKLITVPVVRAKWAHK